MRKSITLGFLLFFCGAFILNIWKKVCNGMDKIVYKTVYRNKKVYNGIFNGN